MIDELLERVGLKYEDLNQAEKETLHLWLNKLDNNKLRVEDIRKYVASMRDSVEQDLTTAKNKSKRDLLLKARLRNYMLLEAFLESPTKAREALERAISGIANKKS